MIKENLFFPNNLIGENVAEIVNEINTRTDYFLREELIFDGCDSMYKTMLSVFLTKNYLAPVEKVMVASLQEHDFTGVTGELDTSSANIVLLQVNVF
ncbi:hypothetical protein BTO00_10680 [Vibrio campbellii]|uniref:hypothetical protein n=1 Tax=Vibrio campbellii TaxID=680 RepID=UPI000CF4F3D6|nr:hypothetical protein [Vibrio campbellii]PQJ42529.1 hypothetical protein BTO00_10680 [Vibrio campbellii]